VAGATIAIRGARLADATAVTFDGTSAGFAVQSDELITATVPSGAGSGRITVTTPAGTATTRSLFTVLINPTITAFTPTSGRPGDTITITGAHFTGTSAVMFNDTPASDYQIRSDTTLTATVPDGASSGPIGVITPGGTVTSTVHPFTVTLSVTGVTPASGPPGSAVVISGLGFSGATGVEFDGTPSSEFSVDSSTQITAIVPAGAGTGIVTVIAPAGSTAGATAFSPVQAPAGTYDVSTTDDGINGDTSSLDALVAHPGPDGISLDEAITAANNTAGNGPLVVSFAPALAGRSIVFAGPFPPPPITRDHLSIEGLTDGNGDPTVTLDGTNVSISVGILFIRASHVAIEHLRFNNVTHNAAMNIGAGDAQGFAPGPATTTDVLVNGNVFDNGGSVAHVRAINIGTSFIAANSVVSDVTISSNSFAGYRNDDTVGLGPAGTNDTVEGVTITRNSFTDTELAVELAIAGATNSSIEGTSVVQNTFTNDRQPVSLLIIDNGATASTADRIDGTTIAGNTFLGTTNPEIAINGGIGDTTGSTIADTTIDDNLLVGGDGVFATGGSSGAIGNNISGLTLFNDTFVSTTHGLFTTSGDSGNSVSNAAVTNTIFSNVDEAISGSLTPTVAYSLFSGSCGGPFIGSSGNLCADPDFTNPAANDYHLQEGSPAIDAGTSDGAPQTDSACRSRYDDPNTPNTGGGAMPYYDIGAFEYGGSPTACATS
jgi:hypothetical protein